MVLRIFLVKKGKIPLGIKLFKIREAEFFPEPEKLVY